MFKKDGMISFILFVPEIFVNDVFVKVFVVRYAEIRTPSHTYP